MEIIKVTKKREAWAKVHLKTLACQGGRAESEQEAVENICGVLEESFRKELVAKQIWEKRAQEPKKGKMKLEEMWPMKQEEWIQKARMRRRPNS